MRPRPRTEVTLTGRVRLSVGWFGRVYAEVEEQRQSFGLVEIQPTATWFTWRKARASDLHLVADVRPSDKPQVSEVRK